jgi:ribosomal protein L7/L12
MGVLCLGRALETGLDRNPNRLNKGETITAGLLLGVPSTGMGTWLVADLRRQRRQQEAQRLQGTFFQLVKAGRGKVTPLRFAMEAQVDGETAKQYLSDRALEYDATFQVDDDGGITYCFNLGEVDSRLLRPAAPLTFDVILEAIPPVKQREVIRTVKTLTGLDWKAVKVMVKRLPQSIQSRASQKTAEEFKRALEAVGAQVSLVLNTED